MIVVVRNSDGWIDASLTRYPGASANSEVEVIPPGLA